MTKKAIHILTISCADEKGLICKISSLLAEHNLNIVRNGEYVDESTETFFIRCELEGELDGATIVAALNTSLPAGSHIELKPRAKKDIVIMATKEYHCLGDLLLKYHFGDLFAEVTAVISNHEHLRALVESFDIPFYWVPADGLKREEHEEKVLNLLDQFDPDLIVLAKYMRILTPKFVDTYKNKIINIHHSFLPAFIGANPYRQAYNRGVKIIGATAHFVTDDLDEGPIIHQSVIPVDHQFSAKGMARSGRDVERSVLGHALDLVLKDRVMINGNKTIIF
ncbi:formyltetrahydrofolate deformylase [Chitinophagales bacterium]|nr:formyltetrahydrofolate deformylase [Chitinophagales bacterium]